MFKIKEFQVTNEYIELAVSAEVKVLELYICFRLRDNTRWWIAEHNKEYSVELNKVEDIYKATLGIKELFSKFGNLLGMKNTFEISIKSEDKYHRVTVTDQLKEQIDKSNEISYNNLAFLKFNISSNATLDIQMIQRKVSCALNNLTKDSGDSFIFSLDTLLENRKSSVGIDSILLRKRIFKNVLVYNEELNIIKNSDNKFTLLKKHLNGLNYENKTIVDFIAVYKEDNIILEVPLSISNSNLDVNYSLEIKDLYKGSFYRNKSNNLSMTIIKSDIYLDVKSMDIVDNSINIQISVPYSEDLHPELLLCSEYEISDEYYYDLFKSIVCTEVKKPTNIGLALKSIGLSKGKKSVTASFSLDIEDLFRNYISNHKRVYKLFVKLKNKEDSYKLSWDKTSFHNLSFNNIKVTFITGSKFTFEIIREQVKPIKLGILGTCFSRAAFDSHKEYFNPDYKTYFKIQYSHFWPSVICSTCTPSTFNAENFTDLNQKELLEIRRDYTKNTFTRLKNENVDYVIIDFFVDATHGTLKIGENQYLAKHDTLRKTKYYKTDLIFKGRTFDSRNPEFFELWKKSCDKFVERLLKIVPENRIILNTTKLTDKFYDEKSNIQSFIKNNKITQRELNYFNMIWTRMDNYFLTKLPNAHVIDMEKYKFISSVNHPVSCGPHHFESNYYKLFVGELLKIVVYNNLLENS